MFLKEFNLAKITATKTAKMLQKKYMSDTIVITNKDKDIKTEADYAAHNFIVDSLHHTDIRIVSEEGTHQKFNLDDRQWIIDPIDGTYNLSRGFNEAAVSISLWDEGLPVFGVIHHLFSNDVFSSFISQGAYKNNKSIALNSVENKKEATLATGFSNGRDFSKSSLGSLIIDFQKYKKIRMIGSAALMLSYVACGYFDVYKEEDIYIWDVAAGLAIVSGANGKYLIEPGSRKMQYNIKAANKSLIDKV
tara:strand:+ start:4387 stop:5130 length:744 start_codon:yes stop_codon:yes gene_type:complete